MSKQETKVIHVHLFNGRKNYYFGSISAVFRVLTEAETGCTEAYLRHVLTSEGNHHITPSALIIRSHLRRGGSDVRTERETPRKRPSDGT